MNLLLVEDHLLTAQTVRQVLEPKFQVTHVDSCQAAFDQVAQKNFEVIVVDLHLPDGSGMELCHYYQEEAVSPRVIILSGKGDTKTKVEALQTGADDYLVKPFVASELQARVRALLRRSKHKQQQTYQFGDLIISLNNQTILLKSRTVSLTGKETAFLQFLLRYQAQIVERKHLEEVIWNGVENRAVLDTLVKTLRQKLQLPRKNRFIETVYGVGYRLNPQYA